MQKIWLVIKNEVVTVVFRRSFFLMLMIVPLVPFIILMITQSATGETPEQNPIGQLVTSPGQVMAEGFVDQSGTLRAVPEHLKEVLRPYLDEAMAREALSSGEIGSYYVIPPDYMTSRKIDLYRADFNPLRAIDRSDVIREAIVYNLLDEQPDLARRVLDPMRVEAIYLKDPSASGRDMENPANFMVPYIVAIAFYIVVFGSASMLLNSITAEKQTRVLEILITSASPMQFFIGKSIALGLVGLIQTVAWAGIGMLLFSVAGRSPILPESLPISPEIIFWGFLFFVLGYALYASLMAGIGALVPNMREASQVTTVVVIPLIIPLMFISVLVRSPNGWLGLLLSLFPFTAPVTMMMRLVMVPVPFWQPLLAAVLLLITSWLTVRSVAGLFRAQNLLTGGPFNLKIFIRALMKQD